MLVKKSKFVWRKKNPPRAQIFRYFCIERRNNNTKFCLRSWSIDQLVKFWWQNKHRPLFKTQEISREPRPQNSATREIEAHLTRRILKLKLLRFLFEITYIKLGPFWEIIVQVKTAFPLVKKHIFSKNHSCSPGQDLITLKQLARIMEASNIRLFRPLLLPHSRPIATV